MYKSLIKCVKITGREIKYKHNLYVYMYIDTSKYVIDTACEIDFNSHMTRG